MSPTRWSKFSLPFSFIFCIFPIFSKNFLRRVCAQDIILCMLYMILVTVQIDIYRASKSKVWDILLHVYMTVPIFWILVCLHYSISKKSKLQDLSLLRFTRKFVLFRRYKNPPTKIQFFRFFLLLSGVLGTSYFIHLLINAIMEEGKTSEEYEWIVVWVLSIIVLDLLVFYMSIQNSKVRERSLWRGRLLEDGSVSSFWDNSWIYSWFSCLILFLKLFRWSRNAWS